MSEEPGGARSAQELETLLLSDLHLGAGPAANGIPDDFDADEAFASFAASLCATARAAPGPRRLVVLGDLLDVQRLARREPPARDPAAAALARIERIAEGHPAVFSSLGDLVRAGYRLEIVPGNHDLDLMRPAAQGRLRDLLCGGDRRLGARVRFSPWLVHVPGVLYAEHGSQYHDINRLPMLLTPWRDGPQGALDEPFGAHLGAGDGRSGIAGAANLARAALADTRLRNIRGRRAAMRRYRERTLAPYARDVGLPPGALARVDEVSEASSRRMATRIARRIATGRGGYDLRAPAREIHGLLSARGADVRHYVFAHSHAADRTPLAAGSEAGREAVYLNTGTWSIPRPRPGLEHSAQRMTYVRIAPLRHAGEPTATLMRWNAAAARHETLA